MNADDAKSTAPELVSDTEGRLAPTCGRLTPKQARFVQEYLLDLNATQAAIRAGYSERTAKVIGHENLTKPYLAAAVTAGLAKRTARVEVTQDYVLGKLVENVERSMRAGEAYEGSVANGALKLLGEHLGMFKRVIETTEKPYREAIEEARRGLRLVA